jgi:predicted alpha/beta hydrolase family esterase
MELPVGARYDELIIPGLFDSGEDHWQSHWLRARLQALKVELGAWDGPTPEQWVARLDRAIARRRQPVFLVAHSLGCLAVAWWARQASPDRLNKVRAALLVAPPDVDRPDAHRLVRPFAPAPRNRMPFASMLVASRTDRYAGFASLADLASAWGSELVDAGDLGHINAESGLDDWPDGIALLERLRFGWSGRSAASTQLRLPERHPTRARSRRT